MEPSTEPISLRLNTVYNQIALRNTNITQDSRFSGEVLLDAICVLYEAFDNNSNQESVEVEQFILRYKSAYKLLKTLRINLSDFEVLGLIGRGQYGTVHVAQERQTRDVYTLKTIRKIYLEKDVLSNAYTEVERDILTTSCSEWLCHMYCCFQDTTNIYFVLDYYAGGDLRGLLVRQGSMFPGEYAKFYVCEIIQSVNALHKLGFIHRDIKPENILIDRCGHIKLADFGVAARLEPDGLIAREVALTPVGTAAYMAPEVLQIYSDNEPTYGKPCDFWSIGICAYELVYGMRPFRGSTTTSIYNAIWNYEDFTFPENDLADVHYMDLLKSLIRDKNSRATYDQLVNHPLFDDTDWTSLRQTVPPFIPCLNGDTDTTYFKKIIATPQPPSIENFKSQKQFPARHLKYIGYTCSPVPDQGGAGSSKNCVAIRQCNQLEVKEQQIDQLRERVVQMERAVEEYSLLKQRYDEGMEVLDVAECETIDLEHGLANALAEITALRRQLDIEKTNRADLEDKILDMIEVAKSKWRAVDSDRIANLTSQLNNQTIELNQLISENKDLTLQLKNSKHHTGLCDNELSRLRNLQVQYETRLSADRNLNRLSMNNIQEQLKQVVEDSESRIKSAQEQLATTVTASDTLTRKFEDLCRQNRELEHELKRRRESCQGLRDQITQSDGQIQLLRNSQVKLSAEDVANKAKISELKTSLNSMQENYEVTKKANAKLDDICQARNAQISELCAQLNTQSDSYNTKMKEVAATDESRLQELSEANMQILDLKNQVVTLTRTVQELEQEKLSYHDKIASLEEFKSTVENTPTKDAATAAREDLLQTQLYRLEDQLKQLHEAAAMKTEALSRVEMEVYKKDRSLKNADIDIRIMKREASDAKTQIIDLQRSLAQASERCATAEASAQTDLERYRRADHEAKTFKEKITVLSVQIDRMRREIQEHKSELNTSRNAIKTINVSEQELRKEIKKLISKNRVLTTSEEISALVYESSINEIKKLRSELEAVQTAFKALKESSTILEEQVDGYDSLVLTMKNKEAELQNKIKDYVKEISGLKCEINIARDNCYVANRKQEVTEASYFQVRQQLKELEGVSDEQNKTCEKHKTTIEQLLQSLTAVEQNRNTYIAQNSILTKTVESMKRELFQLQEESSSRLTSVIKTKDINIVKSSQITELEAENINLMNNLMRLKADSEQRSMYDNTRIIKLQERISQLNKVADHLQHLYAQEAKRKTPLATKLFGHKKEPARPIVLSYKELEELLLQERERTAALKQQINAIGDTAVCSTEDLTLQVPPAQLPWRPASAPTVKHSAAQATSDDDTKKTMSVVVPKRVYKMATCSISDVPPPPQHSSTSNLNFPNPLLRTSPPPPFRRPRLNHELKRMENTDAARDKSHRFKSTIVTGTRRCKWCWFPMQISDVLACDDCGVIIHKTCLVQIPNLCGDTMYLWEQYNRCHFTTDNIQVQPVVTCFSTRNAGSFVSIQLERDWDKYYLKLNGTDLEIFEHIPADSNATPKLILHLILPGTYTCMLPDVKGTDKHSKADRILNIMFKNFNTGTQATRCIEFFNYWDKEHFQDVIHTIIGEKEPQPKYRNILNLQANLELTCMVELAKDTYILGGQLGLYLSKLNNEVVAIGGPRNVEQINLLPTINMFLMIAGDNGELFHTDLHEVNHLASSVSAMGMHLKFSVLNISRYNSEALLTFQCADVRNTPVVCAATSKRIIIWKYNFSTKEFYSVRVLDTAEPCSSLMFNKNSVIVCADQFFSINLDNFKVSEMLDSSDPRLGHVLKCRHTGTFPLSAISLDENPFEYLLCFSEFAIFVNSQGRKSRQAQVPLKHFPMNVIFCRPFLFVFQLSGVEVLRVCPPTKEDSLQTWQCPPSVRFAVNRPKYLASNDKGVFFSINGTEIVFLDGQTLIREDYNDSIDEPLHEYPLGNHSTGNLRKVSNSYSLTPMSKSHGTSSAAQSSVSSQTEVAQNSSANLNQPPSLCSSDNNCTTSLKNNNKSILDDTQSYVTETDNASIFSFSSSILETLDEN